MRGECGCARSIGCPSCSRSSPRRRRSCGRCGFTGRSRSMTRKRRRPPPLGSGGQARIRPGLGAQYGGPTSRNGGRPQVSAVTRVDAVIGRKWIALRTTSCNYHLDVWRWELWPRKTGPRKGQLRRVRVYGEHRDRRVRLARYPNAELAAEAYNALARYLGPTLLRSDDHSLTTMTVARLTPTGAKSSTGQAFAVRLKSLGVYVGLDLLQPSHPGEFWWADF
jgi:hypothetical protein